MNLILFYDTETTGLPDFKAPSEDPNQPHIVQLGAALVDTETKKVVQSLDLIIRPNGWVIPDEVTKVHGITTEYAQAVGVEEGEAVSLFMSLWNGRTRVGHNEQFDARILRIALKRYENEAGVDPEDWKGGKAECTARLATPICALPPTDRMKEVGRFHHKTPNLGEAYHHFFGRDMENAHSAMADVRACMDVYFAIKGAAA